MFTAPLGIRLNSIWRVNSALVNSIRVPGVSGGPAEIFQSDFNGDGFFEDALPGTGRGSFGRDVGSVAEMNALISDFNTNVACTSTPAGRAVIDAGLFTEDQLRSLGGVANGCNPIPLAPDNQVMQDSFITTGYTCFTSLQTLGVSG